jgi:hypothetical protein
LISFEKAIDLQTYNLYLITEVDVEFFDVAGVQEVGGLDDEFEEAFDVNGLVLEFHEQLFLEPTVPEHVGQVLRVLFDPQVSLGYLPHLYLLLNQLHLFFSPIIYPRTTHLSIIQFKLFLPSNSPYKTITNFYFLFKLKTSFPNLCTLFKMRLTSPPKHPNDLHKINSPLRNESTLNNFSSQMQPNFHQLKSPQRTGPYKSPKNLK